MFETKIKPLLDTFQDFFERYRSRFAHLRLENRPFIASDSLISGFKYRVFLPVNHKNKISNYLRAQQNYRNKNMAGSNVKESNLTKNVFSRLQKTQQILANKFIRESLVAVWKLHTKYAVMLIHASYCLSAVEANDHNQTDTNSQSDSKDKSIENVGVIVGSVVGILGLMLAALSFYFSHIKKKDEKERTWNQSQVDYMIDTFCLKKSDKDELQNLKNKVEKMENDKNLRQRPLSENLRNKV